MIKGNYIMVSSSFENLIKAIPEESIFLKYVGSLDINVFNPLRKTTRKTCGYYRNSQDYLILHDFSTGQK